MTEVSHKREDYAEREFSVPELHVIRAHVAACHEEAMTEENRSFLSRHLATFIKQEEQCPHITSSMFEVANKHGVWGVLICDDCGKQSGRECAHARSSWHLDGTVLICDNCGIDGT